jgi:hypothetical protein
VSQNFVYNFRHKESLVLPEVLLFLTYVWRHPSNLLASFKQSANARDPKLVPAILRELVLEEVHGCNTHPLVMEYCLARCFRVKSNKIVMAQCGDNASTVAAVLSILRAGVCSYIVLSNLSDQKAKDFVTAVGQSRVINVIAPMIRRLREMQRRKPKLRKTTVSPEGDIAVDGFEFPRDKWSNVVPSVLAVCSELLGRLFEGIDWMLFLNANTPISVSRTEGSRFLFSLSTSGKEVLSSQLVLKQPVDHALIVDELRAFVEIGFHGFGGGSMRFQELDRLTLRNIRWHFGALYYSAESIKQYSLKSRQAVTITERKLPTDFSRVFFLYDLAARSEVDDVSLLSACANRKHSMPDAFATIFNFSERPDATQIRQLWASISNVTFPKGLTVIVSATDDAAEMSGHTGATHEGRYGSELIGGTELNYRKYHNALGSAQGTSISNEQIEAENLFQALQQIYGPGASYTSDLQREMVVASARKNGKHSHVGLPCGSGKSLAWLLPLVAAAMTSKKIGMQIVVLPYNFLVGHLLHSAGELLQDKFDVSVVSLTTDECSASSLPVVLGNDSHLPNLAFFGLDAFVALHKHHQASLHQWATSGRIHRIFIDEVHTLFAETFRDSYDFLPQIAQYGVPIMTMSGTVPSTLFGPLSRYLGMTATADDQSDLDVIVSSDLLGSFPPGFKIACGNFGDIEKAATERVKHVMSCAPQFALHLICASKKVAERIFEALSGYKIELVTADVSKEKQAVIARMWSCGEFDILVSTTSALVGNESSRCEAVFIVGYIFNLMSVVQAMGRLRPKQRKSTGCIEIFLNKMSPALWARFQVRDKTTLDLLAAKRIIATAKDQKVFGAVGSFCHLYRWANFDDGCRIVALSRRFGLPGVSDCKACDRCHGTPVAKMAAAAKTKADADTSNENKALPVLKRLELMCLVCRRQECDGEGCLGKGDCFKCGGPHFSRGCRDFDFTSLLHSRACFSCLDLHSRRDYQTHDTGKCPLKKRLRRVFIDAWRSCPSTTTRITFVSFVTSIMCDEEHFYRFLATRPNT